MADVTGNGSGNGAPAEPVRAAGGVVWRDGGPQREVMVVHRPKYDDWSLPKGKLEAGESDEEAARREVEEETGLRCRLGPELASTEYHDRFGRPKVVRYWAMSPEGGGPFTPTAEIDEIRWLPVLEAFGLLTYPRDREVLASLSKVKRDLTS